MRASMATWRTSSFDSGMKVSLGSGQLLRLLQLRARARAGHNIVRLGTYATCRLAAQPAHQRLGVRPAHRLQRAGEDKGFAGEWTISDSLDRLRLDAHREKLLDQRGARALEVQMHLARHARTDALDPLQVLLAGVAQPFDCSEVGREELRGRLPDLGNPEREKEMPE